MREFLFDITIEQVNGIRQKERAGRKSGYLVDLYNLIPTTDGLIPWERPIDPFAGTVVDWPFPQLIRGKQITLLAAEASISEVSESSVPWTSTPITLYDAFNPAVEKAITPGGVWHFVDLYNAWYAFNGNCTIWRGGLDLLNEQAVKTYVQDQVTITTGCEHKGRVITGGFDNANFWNADLQAIFNTWLSEIPGNIGRSIQDIGQNWVAWSTIGGGDFPFILFHPDGYGYNFEASAERLLNIFRRNEAGWMPMPFQGRVLAIKPIGDKDVVVYGEDGVAILTFDPGRGSGVPPTYGVRKVSDSGLAQRGAVAGNLSGHIYIDTSGTLRRVTAEGVAEVGYRQEFSPLLDSTLVITHDTHNKRFYISHDNGGYVLESGLGRTKSQITSCEYAAGGVLGISFDTGTDEASLITNEFDMSIRDIKTLTTIFANVRSAALVEVRIHYRYGADDDWAQGPWIELTKEGYARPQISGVDFRVEVRGADYTDFILDYIQVGYQISSKRFNRAPYVDTPPSRAS